MDATPQPAGPNASGAHADPPTARPDRSTARPDPSLTRIERLDAGGPRTAALRGAVVDLRPLPDQEPYSSRAELTLPRADTTDSQTPFVVVHDGEAVGFGVIDAAGYLDQLVDRPDQAALLRAFYIGADHQGRGHGRAAVRLLPGLVREVVPHARILVLTVNEANPAGIRAYSAGGFVDVGRYLGGELGPQRIMVAAVERRPAR